MFKNYLKIAIRHLVRNKILTLIHLLGLTIAITCALLIITYVKHESSFDRFHKNQSELYRVVYTLNSQNYAAHTPIPLLPLIKANIPEVVSGSRIETREGIVKIQDQLFKEELIYVEPAFFQMFSFTFLQGNKEKALDSPSKIVITDAAARKYFNEHPALGKTVAVRIGKIFFDMTIAGIIEEPPTNSSIHFQLLLPLEKLFTTAVSYMDPNWGTFAPRTYLQLSHKDINKEQVAKQISALHRRYDSANISGSHIEYLLQPINEIHLSPEISGGLTPNSRPIYLYLLSGIAFFIILIACLNFTSLSLGNSLKRQREVGLRKTIGAQKSNIMYQFLGEAFLLVLLSIFLSIFLFYLLLPGFNHMLGKELSFTLWSLQEFSIMFTVISLLVTLLAGSYPAFHLSHFQPIVILKRQKDSGRKHNLIRGLTVVQFGLAGFLILCMIIINQQVKVLLSKDLGYDKEQIIRIETPMREGEHLLNLLQSELNQESSILNISGSRNQLGASKGPQFQLLETQASKQAIQACLLAVEPNFLNTMKINILQGHDFTMDSYQHIDEVLVNEAFVNQLGWEYPLGQRVSRIYEFDNARIIGVVEDFHYQPLYEPIYPLVISPTKYITNIYLRVKPGDISASLRLISSHWKNVTSELPFEFSFLDEEIEQQYQTDMQWADIIWNASIFAMAIALMGLFGLGLLASIRRTQEVGIRKVLGASVKQIVLLLGTDIIKPVVIGYLLAIPVAYFALRRWLQNFSVRTKLSVWPFLFGGVLIFLLAAVAVGFQLIRASHQNPVETLRNE